MRTIEVEPGTTWRVVRESLDALSRHEASVPRSVFQRAGRLVHLVHVKPTDRALRGAVRLAPGSMRVSVLRKATLAAQIEGVAEFVGPAGRGGRGSTRKNVPDRVVQAILDQGGDWPFPELRAITTVPLLRSDGTLVDARGFDIDTGTYVDIPHKGWGEAIPASPSKAEAQAALVVLQEPFKEFPFVDLADESVAVAATLTAVARPALGNVPLFLITAHTAGTGKGLLVGVVSSIASGRRSPALMDVGESEAETRKRITATLMAGAQVVNLDNMTDALGSRTLCQVLTTEEYTDRVLGVSETVNLPTTGTTWLATGNNVTVSGDMTRRVLVCRLDAGVERPEDREFARADLLGWTQDNRKRLVAAALTVLRAYHVAGCPTDLRPLGSFETWSRVIRGSLTWLGLPDPLGARDAIEAEDPERQELRVLHEGWGAAFGTRAVTAKEAACADVMTDTWTTLVGKPQPTARDIGTGVLRKFNGRLLDGRKLVSEPGPRKTSVWRLVDGAA